MNRILGTLAVATTAAAAVFAVAGPANAAPANNGILAGPYPNTQDGHDDCVMDSNSWSHVLGQARAECDQFNGDQWPAFDLEPAS